MRLTLSLFMVLFVVSGCSHSKKKEAAPAPERPESRLETGAERAVEKTEEDERMVPGIQTDLNEIFFREKRENPGGLDAFSPDRIQELEMELLRSENSSLIYYRVNRAYFERVEDAGGGFRIFSNGKRLVPYARTRAARRKLFAMDFARVSEMTAQPCFSAAEDCGEFASDGEENTALLEEWAKKYPEKEFQAKREDVLRNYLANLRKVQRKFRKPPVVKPGAKPARVTRRQQAHILIGTHIRGVEMLLEEFVKPQ